MYCIKNIHDALDTAANSVMFSIKLLAATRSEIEVIGDSDAPRYLVKVYFSDDE